MMIQVHRIEQYRNYELDHDVYRQSIHLESYSNHTIISTTALQRYYRVHINERTAPLPELFTICKFNEKPYGVTYWHYETNNH